jgi:aminopeptidase
VRSQADLERYASLLIDDCVGVQPGWQVLVVGQPLGRPLVEEVMRQLGQRGAYGLLRLRFDWLNSAWAATVPEELLKEMCEIDAHTLREIDTYIAILAPENTREGSELQPERVAWFTEAQRPHMEPFMADEKPWVGCQYPTAALAQEAGMSLREFEDFLFGAVLIDWDALERRMERLAAPFDAADEVRIVAPETDLTFSLAGRRAKISGAAANMPSGEFFYGPVEDSASGVIHYTEYPACYLGHQVEGVRLRFENGRVVDASADSDEEFLLRMLDTDEGARRVGEFGIGCNPGIQRHIRNTLFDEKIEGTVHFAVGKSYPATGGTNESALHWDMVKDLRDGGRIELDGQVVQENGEWLVPDA